MKNRIVTILISLALILSFSACDQNKETEKNTTTKTPLPVISDGLPELNAEVLLRQVNPEIHLTDTQYPYLETWSDVIYSKFGVDVKVSFFPLYKIEKSTIEEIYIYDYLRVSPQDGLLLHELSDVDISYNIMKMLIEYEAILPLTDYIENSSFYDMFDHDLLSLMTDDNGDIWGIPMEQSQKYYDVRAYKKSWLDAIGMQVPSTVDEFYDVMKKFTYNDPDGNGKNDTYGFYGPYNFKFSMNDVLKAFGMYNGSTSFIAYNPNTGTLEDSLLLPEAVNALNFVSQFFKEKIVRQSGLSPGIYDSIIPENCGSIFMNYKAEDDNVYSSLPLSGVNTNNLIQVTTYGKVYFMLSGTQNPESMFNAFVKLFYGEEEAYLMLKYGIPGRHFDVDNVKGTIVINNDAYSNENKGKIVLGSSGTSSVGDLLLGLTGKLGIFPSDDYKLYYNEIKEDSIDEDYLTYQKQKNESYFNGIFPSVYTVPRQEALAQSEFVDNWTIKVRTDYSYYRDVEQATVGERIISIEDALEAYKVNMKRLGVQDLIDDANLSLGKVTIYEY